MWAKIIIVDITIKSVTWNLNTTSILLLHQFSHMPKIDAVSRFHIHIFSSPWTDTARTLTKPNATTRSGSSLLTMHQLAAWVETLRLESKSICAETMFWCRVLSKELICHDGLFHTLPHFIAYTNILASNENICLCFFPVVY